MTEWAKVGQLDLVDLAVLDKTDNHSKDRDSLCNGTEVCFIEFTFTRLQVPTVVGTGLGDPTVLYTLGLVVAASVAL